MKREEAKAVLYEWQKSMVGHGVPIDTSKVQALRVAIEALSADAAQGEWISRIDNDIWMLECSVCGCRVQEEKYRIAVGQNATKCPYCGAELGLGGYSYDEYANRPSQRGDADDQM